MVKNGNSATAFIFGAALGVGLGILLAPDKGSKTREKIKGNLDDLKEDVKENFSKKKSDLKDTVEELLFNSSLKAEEAITFLERKLAELKMQNAKLQ